MTGVLLVDGDPDLGETLRFILDEAGYDSVLLCPDASVALEYLRDAPRPVLVFLSHGGPSHDWERVLTTIADLPPHAYIILSTEPEKAPQQWNPYAQAVIPVISMPFNLHVLLEQVAAAEDRLKSHDTKQDAE